MARYHRVEDIIHLSLALQAPGPGLCLEDVQRRFEVGRRTAERMREAVERLYPGLVSAKGADGRKYWRLPSGAANGLVTWLPEELAALDESVREALAAGLDERARVLSALHAKLESLSHDPAARTAQTAIDASADGPGSVLRRAIVNDREVVLRIRRGDEDFRVPVHPHGVLGSGHPELVVFEPERGRAELHPLHTIVSVEARDTRFERRSILDLRRLASNALATFDDGPVDVGWRFAARDADEAMAYDFHADQEVDRGPDGSVVVRFRADGIVPLAWHLFAWGDRVQPLDPPILKSRFDAMVRRALEARVKLLETPGAFDSRRT